MSIGCVIWRRSSPTRATLRTRWLCAALIGLSGCSDGSYRLGGAVREGSSSSLERSGLCSRGADFEFIDQMEDRDGSLDFTADRAGFWFAFNDKTSIQFPEMDLEGNFPMAALERPRSNSYFAARTYGTNFTVWGAGIGFNLRAIAPYDASAYAGIAFWARRAPNASSALRVNVPDRHTSPLGAQCAPCNDDFGHELELDTSFRYFSFKWDELTQRGWSNSGLAKIDTQIFGLRFQTDPRVDFDFWIDDVALLCRNN